MTRQAYRQSYRHPTGVYKTAYGTWFGQPWVNGQEVYLGTFATIEEATATVARFKARMIRPEAPIPQPIRRSA